MLVRVTDTFSGSHDGVWLRPGDVAEFPDPTARALIALGKAEPLDAPRIETAEAQRPPRNAARRTTRPPARPAS